MCALNVTKLIYCLLAARRVDAVSNQKKKATEAEVQKMARTLMVNHDSAPGSMDLHDAARGMVGSHDMEGLSSTLADVEALAPDSEGSEPEKDDAEQDEDEDVELKLKPKKAKWWDRDRHVNKAHKTLMTAYEKLYESASSQLSKCKEVEKEVSALPRKDKKIVEGDLAILQSRYACLQKLWETEEGLRDYIRDFDAPAPSDAAASKHWGRQLLLPPSAASRLSHRTRPSWMTCLRQHRPMRLRRRKIP